MKIFNCSCVSFYFRKRICLNVLTSRGKIAPFFHLFLAAYTSAFARIYSFEAMEKIQESSAKMLYIDCDCYVFAHKKGSAVPLKQGYSFGQVREVYPGSRIVSVASLGPKSLSVQMIKDNEEIDEIHCSGINFKQHLPMGSLTTKHSDYVRALQGILQHKISPIKIPQKRKGIQKSQRFCEITIGKHLNIKRQMCANSYETVPFGWQ